MKEISWGFIGCGEVTEKKSGPAFNDVEGSHIEAVMSRKEEHVRAWAERHGVKHWYTDAISLIENPNVNAIYIATPPASHATYAIMAMRAGKPVYVEKPLAASYEDCVRINRVSEQTGVPCFVAYYRRYLPYFQKIKMIVQDGTIGRVMAVQIRYVCPPREDDRKKPWRVCPEISGGGYFYDMAPHQLDLLQDMFGVITRAHGYHANRAGLYEPEDTVSAAFMFENGIHGSGSWCFVGHESAQDDRIQIIGDKGMVTFSVFNYDPIHLYLSDGMHEIKVANPPYVQLPLIRSVIEHLQGIGTCTCTSISATPNNWVMDRVLGKF